MDCDFSPDGSSVATTAGASVCLWQEQPGARRKVSFANDSEALTVRFSPDASTLLAGTTEGRAIRWDCALAGGSRRPLSWASVRSVVFGARGPRY